MDENQNKILLLLTSYREIEYLGIVIGVHRYAVVAVTLLPPKWTGYSILALSTCN